MSRAAAADRPTSTSISASAANVADPRWKGLYRAAGIGALLTGVLIPLQIVAFVVWPLPQGGAAGWFTLFSDDPVRGLVSYDLAILLEEVLLIPIVLALYLLLRRGNESLMLAATAIWLVSIVLFIASNTAFEMLALSRGYASAATEAERATYLAAGEGMLAAYMGQGTSFVMGYVLASIAGVLAGIAMLRTSVFHRSAAYAAIGGNLLGFGLFLPGNGILLSLVSVAVLIAWFLLIGWRLLRLASSGET